MGHHYDWIVMSSDYTSNDEFGQSAAENVAFYKDSERLMDLQVVEILSVFGNFWSNWGDCLNGSRTRLRQAEKRTCEPEFGEGACEVFSKNISESNSGNEFWKPVFVNSVSVKYNLEDGADLKDQSLKVDGKMCERNNNHEHISVLESWSVYECPLMSNPEVLHFESGSSFKVLNVKFLYIIK